ncbi:hypothetical protein [Roseinatronobacter alkalisoli]|uniref:Uncharacterized protein n=1 Tax=Roseinatronobacter alkalisoli TaxID=3028235 RepID=A0ABT5TFK6_9RHOB|nr:hypothetical protein [Roseinatronobacter sp. HJB301]MDD7973729.1 hypothetical protein [Roseinatronobacter sp. HJB301]
MKKIVLIGAALLSAGVASAQTISPGHAQFAAGLNLDAAQYSMTELMLIEQARRDNDRLAERFYLSGTNRETRGGVGQVSQGKAQIAVGLGVNPADHTLNELQLLWNATNGEDD